MTMEEINGGENDKLEFKRGLSKDDTRWLKTVVAFANGRGGRILFGVDSDLSIVGMGDDLFGAKDSIADAVANRIAPMVPGTDRTFFVDRREFSSPVQDQVESAVQYILEKINMGARFNGVYREDVYEIPPDSIRELIVNAVVHRSYINADASPITIALYDDRLEVTSPGGLVKGMTLEKMKNGYSECRNKALAAAFSYESDRELG